MKKKILFVVVAVLALVALLFGYRYYLSTKGNDLQKEVTIILNDGEKEILNESFHTETSTLELFLKELQEEGKLLMEAEDGAYGMYIKGLGKEELVLEDPANGKYWTYESSNNTMCQEAGFCDAASALVIEDGNVFVFTLTTYE